MAQKVAVLTWVELQTLLGEKRLMHVASEDWTLEGDFEVPMGSIGTHVDTVELLQLAPVTSGVRRFRFRGHKNLGTVTSDGEQRVEHSVMMFTESDECFNCGGQRKDHGACDSGDGQYRANMMRMVNELSNTQDAHGSSTYLLSAIDDIRQRGSSMMCSAMFSACGCLRVFENAAAEPVRSVTFPLPSRRSPLLTHRTFEFMDTIEQGGWTVRRYYERRPLCEVHGTTELRLSKELSELYGYKMQKKFVPTKHVPADDDMFLDDDDD